MQYLGDAFDHCKGSVLKALQAQGVLSRLHVDAMATDATAWTDAHWATYGRLLSVPRSQILSHRAPYNSTGRLAYWGEVPNGRKWPKHQFRRSTGRLAYWGEVPATGFDLFIDPDTGIATSRLTDRHLHPDDLARLLSGDPGRAIVVYQHAARADWRSRATDVVACVRRSSPQLSAVSYQAGQVAFLFFSITPERVEPIRRALAQLLGPAGDSRLHRSA